MNDISERTEQLSHEGRAYFDQLISDGSERPHQALTQIRTDLTDGKVEVALRPAAILALTELTAKGSPGIPSGQPSEKEARASYRAAVATALDAGDEAKADFLIGVLDRTEAKQQATANKIVKIQKDSAKQNESALQERIEAYEEKLDAMSRVEIERLTNSKMTLENAQKFFHQHTRPNLVRSLKASYGLPA